MLRWFRVWGFEFVRMLAGGCVPLPYPSHPRYPRSIFSALGYGVLRAGMSARRRRGRGEGEREQKYSMPFCSAFSTSPRESQELQILPNGRGFFQGGPNMAGYAVLP